MVQAFKQLTEKRLKWYGDVRRMKEKHIVRRMLDSRCGHTREKKKRAAKPKMLKDDRQRNQQGRMQDKANQLHRRPQMTGQARDEEEDI